MSAPTTVEVREALAKEEAELAAEPESQTDYWAGATYGAAGVYRRVALPLAEHRDALAEDRERLLRQLAALKTERDALLGEMAVLKAMLGEGTRQ